MRPLALALAVSLLANAGIASRMTLRPPTQTTKLTGEPISIGVGDADIKDVLHAFSKLTHMSIAIDPDVKASVTIELHDVPWDQALDLILRQNKLMAKFERGVMIVKPR